MMKIRRTPSESMRRNYVLTSTTDKHKIDYGLGAAHWHWPWFLILRHMNINHFTACLYGIPLSLLKK